MSPDDWALTTEILPPEGVVVKTKIHDHDGERNVTPLKRSGKLWFFPDAGMYVYYTPTHWKALESTRAATEGK